METEDSKLISEYINGDEHALAALVSRNVQIVYRFAFRLTRDTHDAEDITQETFVKLWRYAQKYDENKNFKTWLLSIAHNTSIDLLRKRKNFVFSDFDSSDGENAIISTLADGAPLQDELYARAEEKGVLDRALGQLRPKYREILALHLEEDLTFNEIGEILGKSINTVKSQYRRALAELAKILNR